MWLGQEVQEVPRRLSAAGRPSPCGRLTRRRFGFSYLLAAKGIGGVTATKGSYTVSPSQPAKKKRKHKAHKRK